MGKVGPRGGGHGSLNGKNDGGEGLGKKGNDYRILLFSSLLTFSPFQAFQLQVSAHFFFVVSAMYLYFYRWGRWGFKI